MMKTSKISLFLTLITILLVSMSESEVAFAGDWNVGVYLGAPIGYNSGPYRHPYYGSPYYPAPGYYQPRPVYYQPTPVYYTPAPVYYPPTPVYYPPTPEYIPPVPAYYPPVPGYYPTIQPVQPAPVIYTERKVDTQINTQQAPKNSPPSAQDSWWYYCAEAKTYYPYVNKCLGGWLRVAPKPTPGSDGQPSLNSSPKS